MRIFFKPRAFPILLAVAFLARATALVQQDRASAPDGPPPLQAAHFIDVHAHLDPADFDGSIHAALTSPAGAIFAKTVFMPPPFTIDDSKRYDALAILPYIKGHEDRLAVLGGGGILNGMIHEAVRTGNATQEVRRSFKQQAEKLLRAGAVGFGELAAEHFPGATPYQSAPPDHPLFLLLADIAAEHGVPIDLHMEAIPRPLPFPDGGNSASPTQLRPNLAAFERLLTHNPHAHIVWAHAGWDNTGYRTPELCRRLLAAHPNLYMDLKIDPINPGRNSPLKGGSDGDLKPEWLQLFQDFPDRFVIGTDQHYPEPAARTQRWQTIMTLLNQLPPDLRRKIGWENSARLYPAQLKLPARP